MSTMIEDETTEGLDLSEVYGCSIEAATGFVAKRCFTTDRSEAAQVADEVIGRMIEIEARIDAIADTASAKIGRRASYLNYLMQEWTPFLTAAGKQFIPKNDDGTYKKKNHKFDNGGIYFRKTGGWKISDTAALKKHLSRLSVEELLGLGCEPDIKVNRKAILDYVKATGEIMPGVEYDTEDDFGSIKVGAAKGWSPKGAIDRLKAAFKSITTNDYEEGE